MTSLDDFRPGVAPAKRPKKPEWEPPMPANLVDCRLLCFDPSLGATGFVALSVERGRLTVEAAKTLRGRGAVGVKGWDLEMSQAEDLGEQVVDLLGPYARAGYWELAIEEPPLGGGTIRSPESALLACKEIRTAGRLLHITRRPMISPQRHKYLTVGDRSVKKPQHHQQLGRLAVNLGIQGMHLITNEGKRDALSVGIAASRMEER